MKQENLSQNLGCWLSYLDVLPSAKRKLKEILYFDYALNSLYDLCSKSEEEIRTYNDMDDDMITILKNMLEEKGLMLGMTAQDLSNYEDNEYYMSHPDQRPEGFVPLFEENPDEHKTLSPEDFSHVIEQHFREHEDHIPACHIEPEEPKAEKTKVILTDTLKQKLLCIEENKRTQSYAEYINNRGHIKLHPEDIEFMYIHMFRTFLIDQPWYLRLFKKMDERIEMAKDATEDWMKSYKEGIVKAQVKESLERFSQELDNDWDMNWENYIKELER